MPYHFAMEIRPQITPEDVQSKSGDHLRERLVITNLFKENVVTFVMSHHDRILIGGVSLKNGSVTLDAPSGLSAEYLLERRELGLVCLEGAVQVNVDEWTIDSKVVRNTNQLLGCWVSNLKR